MNISNRTPDFKIIFVGDTSVGKTSIIMRYQHNVFTSEFQSTVGAAFVTKQILSEHGKANLNIWDTAGQERYKSLVPMYSRGATAAIIVYDVTEHESFLSVPTWLEQLSSDLPQDCVVFLVGNKTDLAPDYDRSEAYDFAQTHHVKLYFVSALSGNGINELFNDIVSSIPPKKYKASIEAVTVAKDEQTEKKGCC